MKRSREHRRGAFAFSSLVAAVVIVMLVLSSAACSRRSLQPNYEYMPDMARTAAYKSYSPNPVTRNRITLQRPVAGTIPRGFQPFHYAAGEPEAERAGRELQSPFQSSSAVVADGKALYETFCIVCHGPRGEGDGPLVPKIPNPPSYTSERVAAMPPGRLFHVITLGSGRMPSYASQISAEERWKIVSYVQLLQQGRGASK